MTRWPGYPDAPAEHDLLSWHAARRRAHAAAAPLPVESVPVGAAGWRVTAVDVIAERPLPGYDSAAMDGWAVCGPQPWLVVGRTLAGDPQGPALAEGQAREVATGARVPRGAERVIPYETARRCGELVNGYSRSSNVRRSGEECNVGDIVLRAGTRLTPVHLGLLAALGFDDVSVAATPRVEALITGDEVSVAGRPDAGHLRDAIGPALPGLVADSGGVLTAATYVADERGALLNAIATSHGDVVIVTGSSSVGQADHLRSTLEMMNAQPVVVGVACRPGHTQSLWRLPNGCIVVGMPGNPFAAITAFLTLVEPCLAALTGREPSPLTGPVSGDVTAHSTDTRLVPVRLRDGQLDPIGWSGPGMLRGLASAEYLAVVPPAGDVTEEIKLLPLPGASAAAERELAL